ncbi:hypothetical protein ACRJ4W_39460 [Streptomyces sp. GLT-R25]
MYPSSTLPGRVPSRQATTALSALVLMMSGTRGPSPSVSWFVWTVRTSETPAADALSGAMRRAASSAAARVRNVVR